MVVRQDDGTGIQSQAGLDDFPGIDRRLGHRPAKELDPGDQPVLPIEPQRDETLVLLPAEKQTQVIANRRR